MDRVESSGVQMSSIHDVKRARVEDQLIQDVHIVNLGGCYNDHAGYVPPQIQQGVELDSAFGFPEFRPREKRKAQVYGRGVQGIRGLSEFDPGAFPRIQILGLFDKDLSEVPEDSPVPALVGIGKRAFGDFPTDSGMIQFALHGAQAGGDVSQALPESQLREDHDDELRITTEGPYSSIPLIPIDALVEFVSWKEVQQLRKKYSSSVHVPTPRPLSGEGSLAGETFSFEIEKSFFRRRHSIHHDFRDFSNFKPDSSESFYHDLFVD